MNATEQATEQRDPHVRAATLNDVTCRIHRNGKASYSVFVGDRTKHSAERFNRLKDAKAYIALRGESDAILKDKLERQAKIREANAKLAPGSKKKRIYSRVNSYGKHVCMVAGMEVTAEEMRCETDGGRVWKIYLERNEIGYLAEIGHRGRVYPHWSTEHATSQYVGGGKLAHCAARLAGKVLQDRFYGRE
jgi:hypothetical protein